jgi:hypothetical protein
MMMGRYDPPAEAVGSERTGGCSDNAAFIANVGPADNIGPLCSIL